MEENGNETIRCRANGKIVWTTKNSLNDKIKMFRITKMCDSDNWGGFYDQEPVENEIFSLILYAEIRVGNQKYKI